MKLWLALCSTFLLFASPAHAGDQEVQQRFLAALSLINQGQHGEGAVLLQQLYTEAPTPRIRLELARALMLSGRLKEAKALFVEAFKDNPPPAVRSTILTFIDRIDRRRGKLSLSLSVARYANPLQQPGAYSLNFGGIDLTFEPDKTYRNLWGPTVGAQYEKEFSGGLSMATSVAYRSLPGDAADRLTADFSLGKRVGTTPLELKVGAVRLGQKYQSFTLPYAQATYTFSLSTRSAIQPSARVGYYFADSGPGMSGWQADLFIPYMHTPNPAKVFAIGPTILRHAVGYPEQSYTTFGLRAVATMRSEKVNVEARLQGRITRFDAVDPFWGERRKEKGLFGSVMVSSDKVRVGPFSPAVGVSCDVTRSTIKYYQQSSCDGLFQIRKLF